MRLSEYDVKIGADSIHFPIDDNKNDLKLVLESLVEYKDIIREYKTGDHLFRARYIDSLENPELSTIKDYDKGYYGYQPKSCLAPPLALIRNGRCNNRDERVLYAAEDMYTAMAEIKPGKRSLVSIAELELLEHIRLIEFKYHEQDISMNGLDSLYGWLSFYFYIPIQNENEYYRTQRYTQCIKELGYDGIVYSSSMSESGMNVVIFNPSIVRVLNSKRYQTISVLYYAEEQLPRLHKEKLIPKSIRSRFTDRDIDWFFDKFREPR